MSKKNKTPFLVFVALLLVCAIYFYMDANKEKRTFTKSVVVENSDKITTVEFKSKDNNFILSKEDDKWFVLADGKKHNASEGSMSELIKNLDGLRVYSVVSKDSKKHAEYQVNDSLGKHFIVKADKKVLADFYVGKFVPSGQRSVTSYFRMNKKNEVYSVKGFFSALFFNTKVESYRSRVLTKTTANNISKIEIYKGDDNYTLEKKNNSWFVGNSVADSASVANYLKDVSSQSINDFYDQPVNGGSEFSAVITSNGQDKPTIIKGFTIENRTILHSSINEGTYFEDKDDATINKLFKPKNHFLNN